MQFSGIFLIEKSENMLNVFTLMSYLTPASEQPSVVSSELDCYQG